MNDRWKERMVNITEGVSEFNNCLVEYLMDSNFKYALIEVPKTVPITGEGCYIKIVF